MLEPVEGLPPDSALYQHAACGLLLTRADGLIVRVNTTLCRWLACAPDDLVGKLRVQDFFTIGGKVFFQTHCAPMLQVQGSVAEVKLDMLRSDRTRLPMLVNIVRSDHDGQQLDAFSMLVAIERHSYERELVLARQAAEQALSARREAEARLQALNEQLSHADRRKDEFLATLAHELRNPLAPMSNVIAALKLQSKGATADQWSLDVLERQLKHVTHLVDDLMEVSRISQGRMELRREPISLAAAMRSALDDAAGMIEAAGHTLAFHPPASHVTVDADATRLAQIISNLLTNAAKYTPPGGEIALRGYVEEGQAVVSVRDSGIGIPAESLGTIFDMFSQVASALERSQGGLGIGLALVRGLVLLHGGTISAHSEGAGQGSEFIVRLPLCAHSPAVPSDAALAPSLLSRRILVVDDNADAAETMSMALGLLGYQAQVAGDGAGALRAVHEFAPEIVLLDIGLPDINGYEVARRIRSAPDGARMVIIAATGWGQDSDRALAREAGFDAHLTKPIDFEKLISVLSAL